MAFSFIFLVSLYDFRKTHMSGTISFDLTSMKITSNSFVFFFSKPWLLVWDGRLITELLTPTWLYTQLQCNWQSENALDWITKILYCVFFQKICESERLIFVLADNIQFSFLRSSCCFTFSAPKSCLINLFS